jgi:hypothetical protein
VLIDGFPASEMTFGDRERLLEVITPFVSEPVDADVFDWYVA